MSDQTARPTLIELVADLTVAWLSNPKTRVQADELPTVIETIHGALASLSAQANEPQAQAEHTPAVSVSRSLASKDYIISMIDGKPYKMLRRHLTTHGLTPDQYRERYGLKPDYPMVAENYSKVRQSLARQIGLGRKPQARPEGPETPAGASASNLKRKVGRLKLRL